MKRIQICTRKGSVHGLCASVLIRHAFAFSNLRLTVVYFSRAYSCRVIKRAALNYNKTREYLTVTNSSWKRVEIRTEKASISRPVWKITRDWNERKKEAFDCYFRLNSNLDWTLKYITEAHRSFCTRSVRDAVNIIFEISYPNDEKRKNLSRYRGVDLLRAICLRLFFSVLREFAIRDSYRTWDARATRGRGSRKYANTSRYLDRRLAKFSDVKGEV